MGLLDNLKKVIGNVTRGRADSTSREETVGNSVEDSVSQSDINEVSENSDNKTGLINRYTQLQDEDKLEEANKLIQNSIPIFGYLKSKGINYQFDDMEVEETEPSKKLDFMGDYEGTVTLTFSLVMTKEGDVIGVQGEFYVYKKNGEYELVFTNYQDRSNQHLLFFGDYLHGKGITEFESYNPEPQNMSNWKGTLDTGLARINQQLKGQEPTKEQGNNLVMSRRVSNTSKGRDNVVRARRVFNMGVELVYDGLESTNASFESTLGHGLHLRLADAETNGEKYHIIVSSDFIVEGETEKVIYIRGVSERNLGDSLGNYIKNELGRRNLSNDHKKDLIHIQNIISTRSDLRTSTGRLSNGKEVGNVVNYHVKQILAQ